jgi:hypothetical protein
MVLPCIYQQSKQQNVKLEDPPMIRARLLRRQVSIGTPLQESRGMPPLLPSWLMMEEEQRQQQWQQPQDLPMLDSENIFREAENIDQNQKDTTVNFTVTLLPRLSLAAPSKARGARCA